MFPKEHGAYGQLLFPIATALLIARPTAAALAIAGAAVAAFLLHEWLLVTISGRSLLTGVKRLEHTLAGELVSSVILAWVAWPVARAGGSSAYAATACAAAFGCGFTAATVCVRAVIAAHRAPAIGTRAAAFLTSAGLWIALWSLARSGAISIAAPSAAFPMCLAACVLVLRPPSVRHLRRLGWTLVAVTGLCALVLKVALG